MKHQHRASLFLILLLTTACLWLLSSCGGTATRRFGDFSYTVEEGEVTLTAYHGDAAEVTIPESIRGMPVVTIGNSAFRDCPTVRAVTLPDSVRRVDHSAFDCDSIEKVTLGRGVREMGLFPFSDDGELQYNEYHNGKYIGSTDNPFLALVGPLSAEIEDIELHPDTVVIAGSALDRCNRLRAVRIPDSVAYIGSSAFAYCTSLATVQIGTGTEYISALAFHSCPSLQAFTVAEENPRFCDLEGHLFSKDGTLLIRYASAREESSYRVPDGVARIESYAFEKAYHPVEVVIPDSVEEIGSGAFSYCESLRTVHFGNGLKLVEDSAFAFCTALCELTLPDSVEEIEYNAFSFCSSLTTVTLGANLQSIGSEAFVGCDALREVTFRDPANWRVRKTWALSSHPVDLTDSTGNVTLLTQEYGDYYYFWFKK